MVLYLQSQPSALKILIWNIYFSSSILFEHFKCFSFSFLTLVPACHLWFLLWWHVFVYRVTFINIKYKVFELQIKIKPKINPWKPMLMYDKLTSVSSRKPMLTLTSFFFYWKPMLDLHFKIYQTRALSFFLLYLTFFFSTKVHFMTLSSL